MFDCLDDILKQDALRSTEQEIEIGHSRQGRDILAYSFGSGDCILSLIGGCHADEPCGPLLLRKLIHFLNGLPPDNALLRRYQWHIIPHANPDGEARNLQWYRGDEAHFEFEPFIRHRYREKPGDDMEFGFPRSEEDHGARPENKAIYDWWKSLSTTFDLHASLHGMAVAEGPWFLIEPAWIRRVSDLKAQCIAEVEAMKFALFDWDRKGQKGFHRIAPGFSTRPNSQAMSRFFLERNDPEIAHLFRPSSMETIRSFGGDPLTLVSEMPLFIGPRTIRLGSSGSQRQSAPTPMPLHQQMRLQWRFIASGIEAVETHRQK